MGFQRSVLWTGRAICSEPAKQFHVEIPFTLLVSTSLEYLLVVLQWSFLHSEFLERPSLISSISLAIVKRCSSSFSRNDDHVLSLDFFQAKSSATVSAVAAEYLLYDG